MEIAAYLASIGLPPIGGSALPNASSLEWLANVADDLQLDARIIDYWQGGRPVSNALADYFSALGFEIPEEPVERWQIGSSCGIVATDAVTTMRKAEESEVGGWKDADTTNATHRSVLKAANERQNEWAKPSEHLSASTLRRNPIHTRNLWTNEVEALTKQSWQRMKAPEPPEAEGPPCARCGLDHASSGCPSFQRTRGFFERETVAVGALDSAYARIARDLHKIANATDNEMQQYARAPWPKYIISNTSRLTEGSGAHWFVIAYSIQRHSDAMDVE